MPDPVKARPRRERVMQVVQPVATWLVHRLAPLGVDPLWLVSVHSAMGLLAAALIAFAGPRGDAATSVGWLGAAVLLAGKAVLDNVDGGLARATGRVTRMGRYYDTGMDLIVNAALFAALGRHVPLAVAFAGYLATTVVLSLDYNMERLYRAARAETDAEPTVAPPRGAPIVLYRLFERLYAVVLAPQDAWIERLDRRAFARIEGRPYEEAPRAHRRAWSDLFSTGALVDLGLTTQTLVLALLVAAGRPGAFAWLALAAFAWALGVQVRRPARYRAYRRNEEVRSP